MVVRIRWRSYLMETTKVSSYISRRRAKDKSFDEAFAGESKRLEVAVALRKLREGQEK